MRLKTFKFLHTKNIKIVTSLIFLLTHSLLFGENIKPKPVPKEFKKVYLYNIVFGGFLNLGQATLTFSKKKEEFKAIMRVIPSGIAGFLSGHKEEYFEARGKIEKGKILTRSFIRERKKDSHTIKSQHLFNHSQKKIELSEWKITDKKEKIIKQPKGLDFYVQKDVIASFFELNLRLYKQSLKEKSISFETLTLGEDKNRMIISTEKKNKKNHLFRVDLYEIDKKTKKRYGKKTFLLSTGEEGAFKSITIENLFWLGDLVGTLVNGQKMHKLTDQSKD